MNGLLRLTSYPDHNVHLHKHTISVKVKWPFLAPRTSLLKVDLLILLYTRIEQVERIIGPHKDSTVRSFPNLGVSPSAWSRRCLHEERLAVVSDPPAVPQLLAVQEVHDARSSAGAWNGARTGVVWCRGVGEGVAMKQTSMNIMGS